MSVTKDDESVTLPGDSVTTAGLTDLNDVDSQDLLSDPGDVQSPPDPGMISSTLSPEAVAIATLRAAEDRELLARLVREGLVRRKDGDYEKRHPEVARGFVREVEALARPKVNLALRPKSKRRRR